MNFTATIIGQILTFAVLVWFIKGVLWQPMLNVLEDRRKRIADGLEAAERGQRELAESEERATELIQEAKTQAAEIISKAEKRGNEIVEEAKGDARVEGERILAAARSEIDLEIRRARDELRGQVAALAVNGAERILAREIDPSAHAGMLDELAAQL